MKDFWKRAGLALLAIGLTTALSFGAAMKFSTGTGFLPGPRTIDGSDLNVMVGAVNNLQSAETRLKYSVVGLGSVAYSSLGTDTTLVAGTIYYTQLNLPQQITPTKVGCLVGGTGGTDKWIFAVYDSNGKLLFSTAVAGTTASSSTNAFQEIALVSPVVMVPGIYYLALQSNGTTATARTIAASTFLTQGTGSQTGTFGTLAAITTVPTTVTADKGPICYIF